MTKFVKIKEMAISIIKLYEDLQFLLNKNNSEYISPEEFERLAELASQDLFRDYLGERNNRRAVYGHNAITDSRLNVFRVTSPAIPYDPREAIVPVPEGCAHIRSVVDDYKKAARYQDDDRFYMLSSDSTVNLETEVYYKEEGSVLNILTKKPVTEFTIHYLKEPTAPKLPYTFVDREIVFDESAVVNLEWDKFEASNILSRVLIAAGVVIRDPMLTQIGRINKSEE